MKITMINSERLPVPPVLGGAIEQTLFETALEICNPELIVISPWFDKLKEASYPKNKFYHIDIQKQEARLRRLLGNNLPPSFKDRRKATYFYYLNGLTDLLEMIEPDVIQVHNRSDFIRYLSRQFPQKRLIAYMHNQPAFTGCRMDEEIDHLEHLICVSHDLAQRYIDLYPNCATKTSVIYNSVDTSRWHPDHKDAPQTEHIRKRYGLKPGLTLLFVGRTIPEKGILGLIEAMKIVREEFSDAKLLIVGSPFFGRKHADPFYRRIKRRASKIGNIEFLDYIDHAETPYYYAAADVTLVPSLWDEPFGKVIIESMATGVPVIGSNHGAIPEIIEHGDSGLILSSPQDPQDIAGHVKKLLKDEALRLALGINARLRSERVFSKTLRLQTLRNFYRKNLS